MLRSPRRLPSRYNRPVTPQMRRLAQRRLHRHKEFRTQKWKRAWGRLQRRAGDIRKIVVRFLALVVAGGVLLIIGLALFSPILHIQEIRISRSDPRVDAEKVQLGLGSLFGQHLFFLTVNDVADLLRASVPDIRSAQITKQYPSTLQVRLTLDPIIAKLVIDDPDKSKATSTGAALAGTGQTVKLGDDYITSEGLYVVYQPSQVVLESGATLLTLRVVDWGVRPEPWKRLLDREMLSTMQQAESELINQFSTSVRSRAVYVRAREFHLQTPAYTLWFDLRSPLPEQLLRYRLFLQSPAAKNAKIYVDLRLEGKIVYR